MASVVRQKPVRHSVSVWEFSSRQWRSQVSNSARDFHPAIKKQAQLERDSCACWHGTTCPHCPVTTRSKFESSELVRRRTKSSRAPAIRPPASRQTRAPSLTPPHQSLVQRPPFKSFSSRRGLRDANSFLSYSASCVLDRLSRAFNRAR